MFNVLLGGVAYGFVLFLMAAGLSITLGLMRFANMTHAAFAMLGGYIAALLIAKAGWSFVPALAAATAIAALTGALFERFLFRRLYDAPELEQVLLTIGLVYVSIAAATYLVFLPLARRSAIHKGSPLRLVTNKVAPDSLVFPFTRFRVCNCACSAP